MKLFRRAAATVVVAVLSLGVVSVSGPANARDTGWDVTHARTAGDTGWD
ncbi:MAG TPA: hypothetical protein VF728_04695 [Nocardioides sp.]